MKMPITGPVVMTGLIVLATAANIRNNDLAQGERQAQSQQAVDNRQAEIHNWNIEQGQQVAKINKTHDCADPMEYKEIFHNMPTTMVLSYIDEFGPHTKLTTWTFDKNVIGKSTVMELCE